MPRHFTEITSFHYHQNTLLSVTPKQFIIKNLLFVAAVCFWVIASTSIFFRAAKKLASDIIPLADFHDTSRIPLRITIHSQTVCTALGGLAKDLGKISGILQHGGKNMALSFVHFKGQNGSLANCLFIYPFCCCTFIANNLRKAGKVCNLHCSWASV